MKSKFKDVEDSNLNLQKKCGELEAENQTIGLRFKKERESIETELGEKSQMIQRLKLDIKEATGQRSGLKVQIDEYEQKFARMINEAENKSKKHI